MDRLELRVCSCDSHERSFGAEIAFEIGEAGLDFQRARRYEACVARTRTANPILRYANGARLAFAVTTMFEKAAVNLVKEARRQG